MRGWFRYEKYRTTYQLPTAKAGLADCSSKSTKPHWYFRGTRRPSGAIDRAATELGYSKRDYILTNYLALYAEDCRRKGQQPQNMLFANKSH